MKKFRCVLAFIILIALGLVSAGCHPPVYKKSAGPVITMSYDISGFTGVETGYAFEVDIAQSDTYGISITANEEVFNYLYVRKTGDTLRIDTTGLYRSFRNLPVIITINMPELHELQLSGAAEGTASGFKSAHACELALSGASELDIDMETEDFNADLSGASELNGRLIAAATEMALSGSSDTMLEGSGGDIRLDASGASSARLKDFAAGNAYIDLSGSSDASINFTGKLNATLSGASFLEYRGKGTPGSIETSGGSSYEYRE